MLDIRFIRDNQELVGRSAQEKGYTVNIDQLLALDDRRRELQQAADSLRTRRNEISSQMKGGKPEAALVEEGRELKSKIAEAESSLSTAESEFNDVMQGVPNIIFDDVPLGGEEDSVEIKRFGDQPTGARDHLEYATERG